MTDYADLAKWLRTIADRMPAKGRDGMPIAHEAVDEAADAIEELVKERDSLETSATHSCHDNCPRIACVLGRRARAAEAEVAALQHNVEMTSALLHDAKDERDRLKEALTKIANGGGKLPGHKEYLTKYNMIDVARHALEGK